MINDLKINTLIDEKKLNKKVAELGNLITGDYKDKYPVLIAILKGSFIFVADICRQIKVPVIFDFMAVSSYGNAKASSGIVRITKDLDTNIEGKDIIIIEDIIDSGRTLNYLIKNQISLTNKRESLKEFRTLKGILPKSALTDFYQEKEKERLKEELRAPLKKQKN